MAEIQIWRMQAGVRAWVLRAAERGDRGLRQASPTALLSLLCAAAFGPVLMAAIGISGGAAAAGVGVLSGVGGGVLGDIVTAAIDRLRPREKEAAPSQDALERELAQDIERVLAAGESAAQILRSEIATVLTEVDAGGTAIRAAIEAGNQQLRDDLVRMIGELGDGFTELRFLVRGVERATSEIQESLHTQDAKLQALIDKNSQQLTEARLTREAVAVIDQRMRAGDEGTATAPEGRGSRWLGGCPYRGLQPFDETYAEVFYGRERLTAELVGKLAERLTRTGLIIVTGASGAGESSLLRAGLVPALARGLQLAGSARWPRIVMTPTRDPLSELATHLAVLSGADASEMRHRLTRDPGQAHLTIRQAVIADAARHTGTSFPGEADS